MSESDQADPAVAAAEAELARLRAEADAAEAQLKAAQARAALATAEAAAAQAKADRIERASRAGGRACRSVDHWHRAGGRAIVGQTSAPTTSGPAGAPTSDRRQRRNNPSHRPKRTRKPDLSMQTEISKRRSPGTRSRPRPSIWAHFINGEPIDTAQIRIPLGMMNRHGLVAGATGTGKTRTLQGLAEQLAAKGVPGLRRRHQGRPVGGRDTRASRTRSCWRAPGRSDRTGSRRHPSPSTSPSAASARACPSGPR